MATRERRNQWFGSLLAFARQGGLSCHYGARRLCKSLMIRALQKPAKIRIFPLTTSA
jgi:hypothetical protein